MAIEQRFVAVCDECSGRSREAALDARTARLVAYQEGYVAVPPHGRGKWICNRCAPRIYPDAEYLAGLRRQMPEAKGTSDGR